MTYWCGNASNMGIGCVNDITNLVNSVLRTTAYIFTAIVVVLFVVAGILFLTAQGAPEKLATARSAFLWGVVGVAVGIIAYSIVLIVAGVLGAT